MQPTYLPIATIFGYQIRYTVPLFQRPYVWTLEEQWQPLWEDIATVAARVLTTPPDETVRGHFLGSVVLDFVRHPTGSIQRREVIDGQQRLTTLQILLKAGAHALAEIGQAVQGENGQPATRAADVAARQVLILTENSAYADVNEKYKVWPTNEDRGQFGQVMDAASPADLTGTSGKMAEAYFYFLGEMRTWLAAGEPAVRAAALAAAMKDHVRLIVLDLDNTDEPQAIFETLNARGTPLLPADLIKNWLLWEAASQKLEIANLYHQYWQSFDQAHDYWRKKVGTGHAARARVDSFLQNWLTGRLREVVSSSHLYDAFRRHFDSPQSPNCDVPALMHDIRQNAARFRVIDDAEGRSRFATFLRRLKAMDLVVMHPLLMYLLGRDGSSSDDFDAAAASLESFLVRRLVCGAQTRGYGTLALSLLKAIADASPLEPAAPVITSFLANAEGAANQWPDDAEFRQSWTTRRFYGQIRRERVVMILSALEERLWHEARKTEPLQFDFSQLQIEHIMPQTWGQHWPLPDDDSMRQRREQLMQTIGNLTLVSNKLNPSISNGPWTSPDATVTSKRAELRKHTKLWLNSQLVDGHETWDEDLIEKRSQSLFEIACRVWPAPPPKSRVGDLLDVIRPGG